MALATKLLSKKFTIIFRSMTNTSRLAAILPRYSTSTKMAGNTDKDNDEDEDENKPIEYLSSKAAKWKARNSFGLPNEAEKEPWFQMYSVLGSVAVFMIYFCVLREESDIDQQLVAPVTKQFPAMENSPKYQS